jgi:hypothetical protein
MGLLGLIEDDSQPVCEAAGVLDTACFAQE